MFLGSDYESIEEGDPALKLVSFKLCVPFLFNCINQNDICGPNSRESISLVVDSIAYVRVHYKLCALFSWM